MENQEKKPDVNPSEIENQTENQFVTASRQAADSTQKLKKRILIVLGGMVAFIILYVAVSASGILEGASNPSKDSDERPKTTYEFYEPDYDLNIFKVDEYMELDRAIYYCDSTTGVTISLDDNTRNMYDPALSVLCTMIDRIIAGNADRYNDLFSSNYYAVEGHKRKTEFTMQQLYAIKLTKMAVSEQTGKDGKSYTQYEYIVEYKIRQNDGTFRDDVDSDASRKQYFVLSNAASESVDVILIDQVLEYRYKPSR